MKRLLLLLAILFISALAHAQQGNTLTIRYAGVPTGTCGPFFFGVNNATGDLYDCLAGAWHLVSGGGGTSITGTLTTPKIPVATGAHTLGDGSMTDNGTGTVAIPATNASFNVGNFTTWALTQSAGFQSFWGTTSTSQFLGVAPVTDNGPFLVGQGAYLSTTTSGQTVSQGTIYSDYWFSGNATTGVGYSELYTVSGTIHGDGTGALDVATVISPFYSFGLDANDFHTQSGQPAIYSQYFAEKPNHSGGTPPGVINAEYYGESYAATDRSNDYGIYMAGNSKNYLGTGVATSGSFSSTGTNGGIAGTEGTGAGLTAAAGIDLLYPDSTAHRWKMNNNNAGTLNLVGISSAATSGHMATFATNGFDVTDGGAVPSATPSWSVLTNPSGNLSLSMATNTSIFSGTAATNQFFAWKNTTAAVVGTSQGSPVNALCGRAFHGSADVEDCITFKELPGNGNDATINFTIGHTGTSTGQIVTNLPGQTLVIPLNGTAASLQFTNANNAISMASGPYMRLVANGNSFSSIDTNGNLLNTGSIGFNNSNNFTARDTTISWLAAGSLGIGNATTGNTSGSLKVAKILSDTNCSNAASPAVCASASAGVVAVPTGTNPTLTINTTAVTASSQIFLQIDESATIAATTCNTTLSTLVQPVVTARTAATSFTIQIGAVIATNPACVSYFIVN